MFINELSHETVEELCGALEKVPTLDWKVLMRSEWFRYSEDDVAKIETSSKGVHPAKVLLDDMNHREIMLEDLVNGLKYIENNKAVSIIKKDMKGAEKSLGIPYSGGRPPSLRSTGQPQEHSSFSCTQPRREQAETLQRPIQESVAREGAGHPPNPGLGALTYLVETVVSIFPCFA